MANPLLDAALAYAARGWPVFPCNSAKVPYTTNGVLDATTDPEKIAAAWSSWPRANIGFDVGSAGMVVLDLDPGSDRAQLDRVVDGLPDTPLRAQTPRGGQHLYYALKASDPKIPLSASKLAPHVDVRSFHSYVLLPPSRTVDGEYTWESEGKPAFRTDEMVRLMCSAREKSRDRDTWIITPDLPENVELATAWLKDKAKVSVQGQGGDHIAYATAAHMKSFGISQEMAFDLMWEHWNPRCQPPWTADDIDHLERKVENGYSYNTSPPGNITPAYRIAEQSKIFAPVVVDASEMGGVEATSGRFRFVDRGGLSAIRAPEWLIPGLLPLGAYGLLVGAPGSYKTFIALDIALSVATGVNFPWDGVWPDVGQAGKVLFTLGEGRPEFGRRVQAWEKRYWKGEQVQGLVLGDPVPLIAEDLTPFLEGAKALSPEGYKLVVIDTVGRAMQGANENAQEHASNFTRMVERIQRELGATVLALHHTGHGADRARGSSVFHADPDTVLQLERAKDTLVELKMTKQKDAPEWSKPKAIALEVVQLGGGASSLVAVNPKREQVVHLEQRTDEINEVALVAILDNAVMQVLASNTLRAWNTRELAQAVAMREEVECSSKTLQNKWLVDLRERSTTRANKCFDPATGRWKFRA